MTDLHSKVTKLLQIIRRDSKILECNYELVDKVDSSMEPPYSEIKSGVYSDAMYIY